MIYLCFLSPPSHYFLHVEVYRRRNQTHALDCTSFPERLKPLFVNNFHRCVGKNHKIVQACGNDGVGSGSDGRGRHENATIKKGIGRSIEGNKLTKLEHVYKTLKKKCKKVRIFF